MSMIAPVTHFLPLTKIRRARLLPVGGRVVVRVGQKVSAVDVVAESLGSGKHVIVDVWQALGFSATSKSEKWVGRKVGETVQAGDVIAETGGLFRKVVRAPVEGQIIAIGGGQVLLETKGESTAVLAGFSGVVEELVPERGAIIEGNGALIQGVWGNQRIGMGTLQVVASAPDEELRADRLDVSLRGAILVCGHCTDAGVFAKASDLQIRGLILASMASSLIPVARKMDYPVVLVEGLGNLPFNQVAYKILSTNEKREVAVNAALWDIYQGERPEIFIPLPAEGDVAVETDEFHSGQIVRVQGGDFPERTGQIIEVYPYPCPISNGLKVLAARVELADREAVVPLANLDVIE